MVGGLLALVLALVGTTFWIPFGIIMAAALIPVVYSLFHHERSERRGEVWAGIDDLRLPIVD